MKAIRSTMYSPKLDPVTAVMNERSLKVPVEQAFEELRAPHDGMFVYTEVFETDEQDVAALSLEGHKRQVANSERERNLALLYYWDCAQLGRVSPNGVMAATVPAPLSTVEIKETLRQIAAHHDYKGQRIMVFDEEGKLVALDKGKVVTP